MLTHETIWQGIDALAKKYNMSPSGMARKAGLDPTTFNKSKRVSGDGRARWPNTESLSRILEATGADFAEFVTLTSGGKAEENVHHVPVLTFGQARDDQHFDSQGRLNNGGWDRVPVHGLHQQNAFALEIDDDLMEPVYRAGDIIVLSPDTKIERGDRVVMKTGGGEIMAKQMLRESLRQVEVLPINTSMPPSIYAVRDIQWMTRIVWASQ